jgi:signal transduction histidine kinase
VTSRLAQF